jgi:D-xylose transport system ATP-binding protein
MAIPLLRAENVTKEFPGVTALRGVSFDLRPGEIHALCGENGAGKSTLIKLLCGMHPFGSYEGELQVGGGPARFYGVADAEKAGIAVIHQELAFVPEMTAAENLFLGDEPRRGGLIDWDEMDRQARLLLKRFNLRIDPSVKAGRLGVGQLQLLEILKALRKNSKILILDEPTAALTETEVAFLLDVLKDLRKRGISCVYISHKLDEVLAVADRITVLRDGASVAAFEAGKTDKQEIIRHMVGRRISELFPERDRRAGEILLRVEALSVGDGRRQAPVLKDISFEVRRGEVVGLGGLMGAGRTELLMHLFGVWGRRLGGSVEAGGRRLEPGDPRESIRAGLVLVSEDRRRYGLVVGQSVGFNLSLSSIARFSRRGLIDRSGERAANRKMFSSLGVKAPGLEFSVGGLSGGNQQKIVLGKALMTEPSVILLDEPTRGIDVGAKREIYGLINGLAEEGKAVLVASSELEELMGLSDRILMIHEGAVTRSFLRREATPESLMAAAMGHRAHA